MPHRQKNVFIKLEKGLCALRRKRRRTSPYIETKSSQKMGQRTNYKNIRDPYNKKHPTNQLSLENCHLADSNKASLPSESITENVFKNNCDVYVVSGPAPALPPQSIKPQKNEEAAIPPAPSTTTSTISAPAATSNENPVEEPNFPPGTKLRCKNYGCNKYYTPEENVEGCCRHHVLPPFFHDLAKGWSCCKDKVVYDWDDFGTIEGCVVSKHSQIDPKLKFAASPTVEAANKAESNNPGPAPVIKSIEEFNSSNPQAKTALSSFKETVTTVHTTPRKDGKGKCIHKGCLQWYDLNNNTDESCIYHPGNPIFHDRAKYWSCCPDRKAYEFEEFQKIQGCTKGKHDDGLNE